MQSQAEGEPTPIRNLTILGLNGVGWASWASGSEIGVHTWLQGPVTGDGRRRLLDSTVVEAVMIGHVAQMRRSLSPAVVVLLALLPLVVSGCDPPLKQRQMAPERAVGETPSTEVAPDEVTYIDRDSRIPVVHMPTVAVVDSTHEWTIDAFPDASSADVVITLYKDGVAVPIPPVVEDGYGEMPLDELVVTLAVTNASTGEVLLDTSREPVDTLAWTTLWSSRLAGTASMTRVPTLGVSTPPQLAPLPPSPTRWRFNISLRDEARFKAFANTIRFTVAVDRRP